MIQQDKHSTIRMNNLSIGYSSKENRVVVAENIDATISSGEFTCILGANGSGKSTLLRTLCAFQTKLAGEIFILDKEISDYTEKDLSTLISVVLTERTRVQNMTVRELISMGRSPYTGFFGKLKSRDKQVIDNAISMVNIENIAARMINNLSDGERQKTMIAKALAQEVPIILLDEPTAFLDFPSKVETMRLLKTLSRETNKTIFMSSHDIELVLQIADKIWLLDSDAKISIGTPEDLALNGKLGSFYNRKGIVFDYRTGTFKIDNSYKSAVNLTGKKNVCYMITKALARNNILANETIDSNFKIEAKSATQITVYCADETVINVTNIEELIYKMRLLLNI